MAEASRYSSLQMGRGVAALIVVLHHTIGRAQVAGFGPGHDSIYGYGFLGVDFFFVLSGFIIAFTLSKSGDGVWGFIWRRVVRLLPLFWLVFAVSGLAVLIKPSLLGHPIHYSIEEIVKAALLIRQDISDGRSNPPIVGVAWTLHHEVFFYSLAAMWLWRPRLGLALASVVLVCSLGEPASYPWNFILNPLNLEFAFGVGAFLIHRRLGSRLAWLMIGVAVISLPIAIQCWPPIDQYVNRSRVWSAGLPMALMVCGLAALEQRRGLVLQSSRASKSIFAVLSARALERLGDWSYALYLSHYSVMLVCLKIFLISGKSGNVFVLAYFLVTSIVTIAASALLHYGFERPVGRWLSSLKSHRQVARRASTTLLQ